MYKICIRHTCTLFVIVFISGLVHTVLTRQEMDILKQQCVVVDEGEKFTIYQDKHDKEFASQFLATELNKILKARWRNFMVKKS